MTETAPDPRLVSRTDARKINWESKKPNIQDLDLRYFDNTGDNCVTGLSNIYTVNTNILFI